MRMYNVATSAVVMAKASPRTSTLRMWLGQDGCLTPTGLLLGMMMMPFRYGVRAGIKKPELRSC